MNGDVLAITMFDDGTGPAVFAAGDFTIAGGQPANRIAKWDGFQWLPVGSGLDYRVEALAVFDDGKGSSLYAGNANGIWRWDGSEWSLLGGNQIAAMAVFDDGSGPATAELVASYARHLPVPLRRKHRPVPGRVGQDLGLVGHELGQ
jgi:hypothetical protein